MIFLNISELESVFFVWFIKEMKQAWKTKNYSYKKQEYAIRYRRLYDQNKCSSSPNVQSGIIESRSRWKSCAGQGETIATCVQREMWFVAEWMIIIVGLPSIVVYSKLDWLENCRWKGVATSTQQTWSYSNRIFSEKSS